jgi:hypothetical protein
MRKISIALMMVLWGAASAACAEEQTGAAGAVQPEMPSGAATGAVQAEQPAGAVGAPQAKEPSGAPGAHAEQHPGPEGAAQAGRHSGAAGAAHADPAYALKLAAAVRAHVPSSAKVGAGTASCIFQVTANGSMSGISCKGSSPAHSQLLQRAIASTKAPPPPGGSFSANQSVVFH